MSRTLGSAMTPGVVAVPEGCSVSKAAEVMVACGVGSALLLSGIGEGGRVDSAERVRVSGIITERDCLRLCSAGKSPKTEKAAAWSSGGVMFMQASAMTRDALYLMRDRGFRHVPVLSGDGFVVGMFSLRDAVPEEEREADALEELAERMAEHCR